MTKEEPGAFADSAFNSYVPSTRLPSLKGRPGWGFLSHAVHKERTLEALGITPPSSRSDLGPQG